MNENDLISIVMINYNGEKYLPLTISKIIDLQYKNKEIIVVDNLSDDHSLDILKHYDQIRIIHNHHKRAKNFGANLGVSHARGKYVLLVDNDVLLTNSNLLKELLEMYLSVTKVGCIGLSFVEEGKSRTKSYGNPIGYYYISESLALSIETVKQMHGKFIAFPEGKGIFIQRKRWLDVGGYDDYITFGGDDSDLGIRLWIYGYRNYLYSRTIQIHIGKQERDDNDKYLIKLGDMIFGHYLSIVKNFTFFAMVLTLGGFSLFAIGKTFKQSIRRRNPLILTAYLRGLLLFILSLPYAFKRRKEVQSLRTEKRDIFMNKILRSL